MAFSDYSATPASNTTIAGKSIAENCPAANINDAIRELMADGRSLSDQLQGINLAGYMPLTGGAFTNPITLKDAGSYLYFASSSMTGGAVYIQPASAALPSSPVEGTIVFQY